ncbi:MAG: proton-conducting transporter membrane subunit [Caldilineaceae bacterium]
MNKRAAGLAQRQPLLAFTMAVFMFGLAGMPPLADFFGKLLVFQAAVAGGWAWLAAVAMLTSAIARTTICGSSLPCTSAKRPQRRRPPRRR